MHRTRASARKGFRLLLCAIVAGAVAAGCDSVGETPLAPYEGERPLIILKVTESFAPDIQWVGGLAAAVGINRGTRAALDTSLVWMARGDGNTIRSPLRVREDNDEAAVSGYGGVPLDSLADGGTYTLWIADQEALDAGLSGVGGDSMSFRDTTFTLDYALLGGPGQTGGDRNLGVQISVVHDETLEQDRYLVIWTPSDVPFRQVFIRKGSSGGFTDAVWYVAQSEGEDALYPPLVIGETPPGAAELTAWPNHGFTPARTVNCPEEETAPTYYLWMSKEGWSGSFSPSAANYAWMRIIPRNFEDFYACP